MCSECDEDGERWRHSAESGRDKSILKKDRKITICLEMFRKSVSAASYLVLKPSLSLLSAVLRTNGRIPMKDTAVDTTSSLTSSLQFAHTVLKTPAMQPCLNPL